MPPRKPTKEKAQAVNNQQQDKPSPQKPTKKRAAAGSIEKPNKRQKRDKKAPAATQSSPGPELPALPPLTSDQILTARESNPPDCYVVGPPKNKWVDNAKALASYLGFEDVEHFRDWLQNGVQEQAADKIKPIQILDAFLRQYENNYGKAVKASGSSRTNVSRNSIWDQLANNSQELMPQMSTSARYVLRL
jgi:hypothetical protein